MAWRILRLWPWFDEHDDEPLAVAATNISPDPVAVPIAVPTANVELEINPSPVTVPLTIPSQTVVLALNPSPVTVPILTPAPTVEEEINPSPPGTPIVVVTPRLLISLNPSPVAVPIVIPAPTATSGPTPSPVPVPIVVPAPLVELEINPSPVAVVIVVPAPVIELTGGQVTVNPDPVPIPIVVPPVTVSITTEVEAPEGPSIIIRPVRRPWPSPRRPVRRALTRARLSVVAVARTRVRARWGVPQADRLVVTAEARSFAVTGFATEIVAEAACYGSASLAATDLVAGRGVLVRIEPRIGVGGRARLAVEGVTDVDYEVEESWDDELALLGMPSESPLAVLVG